jgi:hypothetical protein
MQIAFSFDELSKIVLAHVRARMNVVANKVDIPSTYSKSREDFCVVTTETPVEQVPLAVKVEPEKRTESLAKWREDIA